MKKTFLFLYVLCFLGFFSATSNAQNQQYKPSLSDLSGNGPSMDGKGYVYNFRNGEYANCAGSVNNKGAFNQFQSLNYSYTLDTEHNYFVFNFNGLQEKTELLCNHFTSDNCFFIEKSATSTFLDLSDPKNNKIELNVRSNVPVEKFGIYVICVNDEGFALIGDGDEHASYELKANKWTTIKTKGVFTLWNGTPLDPTKVVGIGLYAKSSEGLPYPKGSIEIDDIRIGSSVHKFDALGTPHAEGYTYNFMCNETNLCKRQINILSNPIFTFSLDQTNHDGLLKQEITNSKYNLFAWEFTDPDCFLQTINLENKAYRFVEVKIKPALDIHSFSVSLAGDRVDNNVWDYSYQKVR